MKIEVFLPLGSCICSYAPFMEKVGRVTSKFKDSVEVQIKSIKSSEASKHGIRSIRVLVDRKIRLHSNFEEKDLEDAIITCTR